MSRGTGPLGPRYDQALDLASRVHHEQFRKGTRIAYLSHVMTVSALALEDDGTEDQAIAALLHDAVEDGPADAATEIERLFGPHVRSLVEACSDGVPGLRHEQPWRVRKEAYVRHLEDGQAEALVVTAADKLHNLRCTLDDLHVARRRGVLPSWPESRTCVHLNLWYYASVLDVLERRLPESRSVAGLRRVLDEVVDVLGAEQPEASSTCPTCQHCSSTP